MSGASQGGVLSEGGDQTARRGGWGNVGIALAFTRCRNRRGFTPTCQLEEEKPGAGTRVKTGCEFRFEIRLK